MKEYPSTLPRDFDVHLANAEKRFHERTIIFDSVPEGFETDLNRYSDFDSFLTALYAALSKTGNRAASKIRDRGFDHSHAHDWTWDGLIKAISVHRTTLFPCANGEINGRSRDRLRTDNNRARIESENADLIALMSYSKPVAQPDKVTQFKEESKRKLNSFTDERIRKISDIL